MVEKIALFEANNNPISWQVLSQSAINSCLKIKKEREKEILAARFGIGGPAKTLQSIGNDHGITRERVRQITNNALNKIKKHCTSNEIKNIGKDIMASIRANGGYASSDYLANKYCDGSEAERNGLNFVISLIDGLENVKVSNEFNEGWRIKKIKISDLKQISADAFILLKEEGDTAKTADLATKLNKPVGLVTAALSVNKHFMKSDDEKWGLTKWPHVNPRSIRDKSKYVMVRHGKPIHYSKLADKISQLGTKNVTKQSVHNELIKNSDFVLVGRGIYALSEWGYAPGIVEDVIVTVLSEAGEPLSKEIIVERVLERRLVKPSTIVLNLQRPRFKKVGKAVYTLS